MKKTEFRTKRKQISEANATEAQDEIKYLDVADKPKVDLDFEREMGVFIDEDVMDILDEMDLDYEREMEAFKNVE